MKNSYILLMAAVAGMSFSSCDDFLDKPQLDEIEANAAYWNSQNNVELQCNRFYNAFSGYGSGQSYGSFYFDFLNDDQASPSFANWHNQGSILGAVSDYNTPYEYIRGCNYVIENMHHSSIANAAKYEGIAKFNRAYQFYQLVRRFGDVQWVSDALKTGQTDIIYGARDNRNVVVDSILRDLDYAIATIGAPSAKSNWSSDAAAALKAEVCLYEGTFCRYCTKADNNIAPNEERAKKYLNEAVKAAEIILGNSAYQLNSEYGTIYNSVELKNNPEVIFYKPYSQPNASFGHGTIAYTSSTTTMSGINKSAFDSFLFLDGKPKATTTLDKSDKAAADCSIENLLNVRDKRLAAIVDPRLGFGNKTFQRLDENGEALTMTLTASTGYTIKKFFTDELTYYSTTNIGQNYTSAPLFYLAPVMLAYAEAKAELGSLGETEFANTIKKLYDRAGISDMTVAKLASMNDPANNMNVSSLIWEIRRCRRSELMLDNFRYWDLVRWHQLELLDNHKNPDIFLGANVANVTGVAAEPINVDANGYIEVTKGMWREYKYKYYLDAIPSGQISLNENLGQNYGW